MKKKIYPAIIERDSDVFVVLFPDLGGCVTQGATVDEAYAYAKEALGLYLDGLKKPPLPSDIFSVQASTNGVVMLVEADDTDDILYYKQNEVPCIVTNALQKSGFTKYQVAKIMGVSESYINRIANGERTPSPDMAKRIGTLLDLDWQVFYA
ncbi:MAG: type II toxin-antitoxin system HicB family antitoxin [Clostridia bacterium]